MIIHMYCITLPWFAAAATRCRSSVLKRVRWDLLTSEGLTGPRMTGGWLSHPSEKYESIGMMTFPIYGEKMLQTTNQNDVLSRSLHFCPMLPICWWARM